nr:MAG: putative capsid protein [Arizlama virus]
MPFKRRKTFGARKGVRKARKMPRRKLPNRNRLSQVRIRQPSGLPDRTFVKQKLVTGLTYDNTSGGWILASLPINDINDPLGSTGADQPYLYDQWKAFYSRALVHGVKVKTTMTLGSVGISSTSNRELLVVPSPQSTLSTVGLARMQPYLSIRRWMVNAGRPVTVSRYISCSKVLGLTREKYVSDPGYTMQGVDTSPAKLVYLHIGTWDPVNTTTVTTYVLLEMTYYVEYSGRLSPAV